MKIILVHNHLKFQGGEDTYFDNLSLLLKSHNHQVIKFEKDSNDIEDNLFGNIKAVSSMIYPAKTINKLESLIKKELPDLIHFSNIYPLITPWAYQTCRKYRIPIVQTIHNHRLICPKGSLFRNNEICRLCQKNNYFIPAIYHGCYHNSRMASFFFISSFLFHKMIRSYDLIDTFIFPSRFAYENHREIKTIPKSKVKIIPNFTFDKRKPIKKIRQHFLYVGNLSHEKGVIDLLEIFKTLPEYKLVVIGGGALYKDVIKYQKYKNISIQGILTKNKIFELMQEAIFTVVPSLSYEVMPQVIIESYVNGIPVIGPSFGIFKEIVNNNKTGLLYKYADNVSLRKTILLSLKKDYKKMGNLARKEYEIKYSEKKYYESIIKIYNSLTKTKN